MMLEFVKSVKFFPTVMVVCSILASIRYGWSHDWKLSIYWAASATLISAVTY
jgi:hypothetical protein